VPDGARADADAGAAQLAAGAALAADKPVWAGIGANRLSQRETLDDIGVARRAARRASSVLLRRSDQPAEGRRYLSAIGRGAFAGILSGTDRTGIRFTAAAGARAGDRRASRSPPPSIESRQRRSDRSGGQAFGRLTFDPDRPAGRRHHLRSRVAHQSASPTTPLVMQQLERGVLTLDDPVSAHMWNGAARDRRT
jgi:hypothetical protein